jgi:hypothetical protein
MTDTGPQIDWKEYKGFVNEFEDETDRAAVILGAAKLDTLLYQLLGRFFLPSPTGKDELLDGDSPLSTFSSRINVAFRLGLIDAPFARALHLIRRIRNSFAHELTGCNLDSGAHRDRVKELVLPFKGLTIIKDFDDAFFSERKHSGPSAEFRTVLGIMIGRLEIAILKVISIKNDRALELTIETWKKEKTKKNMTNVPQITDEK